MLLSFLQPRDIADDEKKKASSKMARCNFERDLPIHNFDNMRFVGYEKASGQYSNKCMNSLFSDATGKFIQDEVTKQLGRELLGRPIQVSMKMIWGVLSDLNSTHQEQTGDIYGRLNVPNDNLNSYQSLVNQTITVLVDHVRTSIEMEQHNGALSVWDTVLGDFNDKGLRSHPPLTANIDQTRRLFQINMNY